MLAQAPIITFLVSADLNAARAFYTEVLGLPAIAHGPQDLVVRLQDADRRISRVETVTPAAHTVLGWVVADIAASVDTLAARGVVFRRYEGFGQDARGIMQFPGGVQVAWFSDPDGNLLSLSQLPAA